MVLRLGRIAVDCTPEGRGARVTLRAGRNRLSVLRREGDPRRAAALVLEDVACAAADREGFVREAMGDATGSEALRRWRRAEALCRFAKKVPLRQIEAALEDARRKGIL